MTTTTTFSSSFAVKLVGITAAAICMMFLILRSSEKGEREKRERVVEATLSKTTFKIIYASQNGTAHKMAQELANLLATSSVLVLGIKDYEWEDLATETAVVVGCEGKSKA
jgi:sulfite reductase alpha subunit-like flavoprotein